MKIFQFVVLRVVDFILLKIRWKPGYDTDLSLKKKNGFFFSLNYALIFKRFLRGG